ncbi:hypothetical protein IFM89_030089 [Coptis chinensis]|uniref:Uncharacterized protein n=1 Tax=Coptis chinensis TaxID=261450 RepID=A0A835LGX1_9MAGN|nr:hypothetical protein IFM89_030089 [Coptis chinensis]
MEEFDYSCSFSLVDVIPPFLSFLSHRDYGPLPQGALLLVVSALLNPEGILRFVMLSDGSCYLHDLITLWPCYCTFQGTQRQNIALDNPRLLSCSHGIYFRLFWNACEQGPLQFKLHVSRPVRFGMEFSFLEFMSLVDVWGYRQPTIVLELMGKHALMIYILAACNLLPLFLHAWILLEET